MSEIDQDAAWAAFVARDRSQDGAFVVAVIAILAAIAYPSYINYVVESRRTTATACLVEHGQFMERLYTTNLSYQVNPDWRFLGRLDFSVGDSDRGDYFDGDFVEASLELKKIKRCKRRYAVQWIQCTPSPRQPGQ